MGRIALAIVAAWLASAATTAGAEAAKPFVYGNNPAAGETFLHDGIRLYYEAYGQGAPLLLIHGNGASIWSMKRQIVYFSKHYRVIAMDSRDHGKSGDAPGRLTFEAMAGDLAALLDHLHTGPAYVLGWSDGGIEALELGLHYPDKVIKIASMAANIDPQGLHPDVIKADAMVPKPAPGRETRVKALDDEEPNIKPDELSAIKAPTLILASDHDVIADEHTLTIYHHLPNAELAIFPGATHMIPYADAPLFNATVERFFATPFEKTDRLGGLMKTIGQMKAEAEADRAAAKAH